MGTYNIHKYKVAGMYIHILFGTPDTGVATVNTSIIGVNGGGQLWFATQHEIRRSPPPLMLT